MKKTNAQVNLRNSNKISIPKQDKTLAKSNINLVYVWFLKISLVEISSFFYVQNHSFMPHAYKWIKWNKLKISVKMSDFDVLCPFHLLIEFPSKCLVKNFQPSFTFLFLIPNASCVYGPFLYSNQWIKFDSIYPSAVYHGPQTS